MKKKPVLLPEEILRTKFTKTEKHQESELFASTQILYSPNNPGLPAQYEIFQLLMINEKANNSEEAIRSWIERFRQYAKDTLRSFDIPATRPKHVGDEKFWLKMRGHALNILNCSTQLLEALDKHDWFRAIRASALLERAIMKSDLAYKDAEKNAEMGREISQSNTNHAHDRWASTASRRKERNDQWKTCAAKLRQEHLGWSNNRIGERIKKVTGADEGLRTILDVVKNEIKKA